MNTVLSAEDWTRLQEVVSAALEMPTPDRARYLNQACGLDTTLRVRAESLLSALDEDTTDFFDGLLGPAAAGALESDSLPGDHIGPYRILQRLGQGGMGVVFKAVRDDDQYRKEVAIKLASSAIASGSALRHFRAERQILADLDHPNIARLLDGGSTSEGTPYVIMEYVDGATITDHCRARSLTPKASAALVAKVARAVAFAHSKLIVHCDIKPGNILVARDGEPKLLDFGIARLLTPHQTPGLRPAATTAFTAMTPDYAAPEQVRGESISTATDVYQLGVVLYELVSGTRPFTAKNRIELEWAICEQLPRTPAVDTDLGRIILKALAKEPARRYATAQEFAGDLDRYLAGRPVQARPPQWGYLAGNFIKRHRWATAATFAFVVLLIGAFIALSIATARARAEAQTAQATSDFVISLLNGADLTNENAGQITVRDLLRRSAPRIEHSLIAEPEVRARLLTTIGDLSAKLADYQEAQRLLTLALKVRTETLHREDDGLAETYMSLGDLADYLGDHLGSEKYLREAVRLYLLHHPDTDPLVIEAKSDLACALFDEGKLSEALDLNVKLVAMRARLFGNDSPGTLTEMNNLQSVLYQLGYYADAERIARQVLERRIKLGSPPVSIAASWANLASCLDRMQRYEEAETAARTGLSLRTTVYGPDHPSTQPSRYSLAGILAERGRLDEAWSYVELAQKSYAGPKAPAHAASAWLEDIEGTILMKRGDPSQALGHFRRGLELRQHATYPLNPMTAESWMHVGQAEASLHHPAAAEDAYRHALAIRQNCRGLSPQLIAETRAALFALAH